MDPDTVFNYVWWGILFYIIGGSLIQWRLLRQLKDYHHDKWVEMGEPTMFWNNSQRNMWRLWKLTRKGDPELERNVDTQFYLRAYRIMGYISYAYIVGFVIFVNWAFTQEAAQAGLR